MKFFKYSVLSFLVLLFGFILSNTADAATLTYWPNSGSYLVGETFSVGVYLNSADTSSNAASGIVNFPSDKLEATSASKSGTIFSLWVKDPVINNSAGTVSFEGVILNPGFTGDSGKIMTITFRAKAAGNAAVGFNSGSILANDGQGTNILKGLGRATYDINVEAVGPQPPKATSPSSVGTPLAPLVTSDSHSDPDKWYTNNNVNFSWNMPGDITGVNILADRNPNSNPGTRSEGVFSTYIYEDVEDDIWYFHIRLRNSNGWGAITHQRFQIDTEKPSFFKIMETKRSDPTDPVAQYVFDALDETSGIDYYNIQIDNEDVVEWVDDGKHTYKTKPLAPGKHRIILQAVDKAGNHLTETLNFNVEPLDQPKLIDYPQQIEGSEPLIVTGETYSGVHVVIWLQRSGEEAVSKLIAADSQGKFTFIAEDKLKDGVYKLWAEVIDGRGARSETTPPITIAVTPSAFMKFGTQAMGWLAVIVSLVALVILLAFLVVYSWRKIIVFRKRLKKEVKEAQRNVHQMLEELRNHVGQHIKLLEKTKQKRKLTDKEKHVIKLLKKDVDNLATDIEKYVSKEIRDIGKDVEGSTRKKKK